MIQFNLVPLNKLIKSLKVQHQLSFADKVTGFGAAKIVAL